MESINSLSTGFIHLHGMLQNIERKHLNQIKMCHSKMVSESNQTINELKINYNKVQVRYYFDLTYHSLLWINPLHRVVLI